MEKLTEMMHYLVQYTTANTREQNRLRHEEMRWLNNTIDNKGQIIAEGLAKVLERQTQQRELKISGITPFFSILLEI